MNWIRKIFGRKDREIKKKERIIIVPSRVIRYAKVALPVILLLEKDDSITHGFGEYKRAQVLLAIEMQQLPKQLLMFNYKS